MKQNRRPITITAKELERLEALCDQETQAISRGEAVLHASGSRILPQALTCEELIALGKTFADPRLLARPAILKWRNCCRTRQGL